jgi:hypothetical protein
MMKRLSMAAEKINRVRVVAVCDDKFQAAGRRELGPSNQRRAPVVVAVVVVVPPRGQAARPQESWATSNASEKAPRQTGGQTDRQRQAESDTTATGLVRSPEPAQWGAQPKRISTECKTIAATREIDFHNLRRRRLVVVVVAAVSLAPTRTTFAFTTNVCAAAVAAAAAADATADCRP